MPAQPFLKEVSARLLHPGAYNLEETFVVFPNKRARLFMGKYMGELTDRPVWAPQYLTISEMMERASGYVYADRLTLLFELYGVYRNISGSQESFDIFYPYGETLLADFDEIDKYLVHASDIFGNLAGLKSLENRFSYLTEEQIALIRRFWDTFDPHHMGTDQKTFITLWEILPDIYHRFRKQLHDRQIAYEGMAYRNAAEHLTESSLFTGTADRKFVFVGFNALNTCEEKVFSYLQNLHRAEFFWDYDAWYTNNEMHEAGFFMRKNLKSFPQRHAVNCENLSDVSKTISFIPVSSNTGQAAALPHIFRILGIGSGALQEQTALVLADEHLIIPVLYAIPSEINEVNVTMGFPLAGSLVYSLIDSLHALVRNSRKDPLGKPSWYFKDVLSILGNPLLSSFYAGQADLVRQKVIRQHLYYLCIEDILAGSGDDPVFTGLAGDIQLDRYLLDMLGAIMKQLAGNPEEQNDSNPVQAEMVFRVYTFLTRLHELLIAQGIAAGAETLFRLIRNMIRSMHVPFEGEPLAGLQVMGLLETRTLDFENVIILSANEGILPRAADTPSFIPYSLRAGFGMPTPEHHDAMYAYYFYRLIQRANKVTLVYDSSSGGLRTGERSRYLHQIFYEMPARVTELSLTGSISRIPVKPIVIPKTGEVAAAMERYTGKQGKLLSPSAFNEFLNCPLKFYFHQLAGLPQTEELSEEIDARRFGNLLHKAMKHVYSPFGTSPITPEHLKPLLSRKDALDDALDQAFSEELSGNARPAGPVKTEGYNLIIRQVIRTYMHRLLTADLEAGPFSIVSLEEKYQVPVGIEIDGRPVELQIGGIIDRIDRRQGKFLILDYKTGAVRNTFSSVSSLFQSGEGSSRNDAVSQVLLYAFVFQRLNPESTVVPGLYFVRGSYSGAFSYFIRQGNRKELVERYDQVGPEFEGLLHHHLSCMFSSGEPFVQTTHLKTCAFCSYAEICRR
jgi:hypothetical protein